MIDISEKMLTYARKLKYKEQKLCSLNKLRIQQAFSSDNTSKLRKNASSCAHNQILMKLKRQVISG